MKLGLKNILLYILILLFVTSCSIEKRRYTKGYHVEWNNSLVKQKAVKKQNTEVLVSIGSNDMVNVEKSAVTSLKENRGGVSFKNGVEVFKNKDDNQLSLAASQKKIVIEHKSYGKKNTTEIIEMVTPSITNNYNLKTSKKTTGGDLDYIGDIFGTIAIILVFLLILAAVLGVFASAGSFSGGLVLLLIFAGLAGLAAFFYYVVNWEGVGEVIAVIGVGLLGLILGVY